MMRENLFYRILSAIHFVFFTSILCFSTVYLTGTLLMIPAFGATFLIGKDYLYKKLDINSSIVMTYFRYLKAAMKLIKFIPINFIMILNIIGMIFAIRINNVVYSVICLTITVILLLITLYLAGYFAFVDENVDIIEVMMSIILKPQFVFPVFAVLVVAVCFFSFALMLILLVLGSFLLFALSVLIFMTMLYYKKAIGKLSEEDEYYHLINNRSKRR